MGKRVNNKVHKRKNCHTFFKYAKDKSLDNVKDINDSVVNRLEYIIKNPNLNFKAACGRFYYKKLMNNPNFESVESDSEIIGAYEKLKHKSTFILNVSEDHSTVINGNYVYGKIRKEILEICDNPVYVTDVLIDYLYNIKKENKKN